MHLRNTTNRDLLIKFDYRGKDKDQYFQSVAGNQQSIKLPRGKVDAKVLDAATRKPCFAQRLKWPRSDHSLWLIDTQGMMPIATSKAPQRP